MAKFYTPGKLSDNIRETPEGYLLCLAVPICRTGWQVYGAQETPLEAGEDGTVRVYRAPEEVLRPETIASFQGKSITIRHPNDFVGPANWQSLTRGHAQNVRDGGKDADGKDCVIADLLITELMAINLVKNGLREVSCGYEAEYEQTGEGEGRQYNIIGNHIALVEEGRAGSSYAINDHKGKVTMKQTLLEKLTKRFGAKVIDEVMAEDADKSEKKEGEGKDAASYDELVKMVKDLGEKIEGMGKSKDESEEKPEPKKKAAAKEEPAKDEDAEESEDDDGEEMKIEERIKALEAAVAKLLEKMGGESEDEEGEEGEEGEESQSEDEDGEESEDAEESEHMTGDAARIEILAPGLKATKKEKPEDTQKRALVAAFGTKDGRAVIESITGKKKLVLDSAEQVSTLFIAASEVLKAKRGTGLEKTKDAKAFGFKDGDESATAPMTAEKMNELNAAHWARK